MNESLSEVVAIDGKRKEGGVISTLLHLRFQRSGVVVCLLCGLMLGCGGNEKLSLELQGSFIDYTKAIESLNEEALLASVYFPGVSEYKAHVQKLLLDYLEQAQTEESVRFDEQGVVLIRFLGMAHHRFQVKDVGLAEDGQSANMRIAVRFSYDSNIAMSNFEDGTKILLPGEPWGSVITITIGGETPIPREQLDYAEIDIQFRKTNMEGKWQVRRCVVDEESLRFVTSLEEDF